MALSIWTQPSGYSLGTFPEQITVSIPLPLTGDITGVAFKVISGELPSGLSIVGSSIIGSPYIVANTTNYKFCIRASKDIYNTSVVPPKYLRTDIADRTFGIIISGFNPPVFVTPAGLLPVGDNKQYYTVDQTYISYALEVTDLDIAIGQALRFFIADGDGTLPPGLSLSRDGVISGYVKPAPRITVNDGVGNYDEQGFDVAVFDFGLRPTNGFDTYHYDNVIFDYSIKTKVVQTLSLNYQFKVTVTDGVNYAQRIFKIFVTGSDEFRADSTTLGNSAGSFTADSTYVRKPVWITDGNLGLFRSNNYLTVPVALYDNTDVSFRISATNEEVYVVAYKLSSTDNVAGSVFVTVNTANNTTVPQIGQYFTLNYYLDNATDKIYTISNVQQLTPTRYRLTVTSPLIVDIPNSTVFYTGTLSKLPPGVQFDELDGDLYGIIPYQPAVTTQYVFTLTASRPGDNLDEISNASRKFNITILGSVNSVITWITPTELGSIPADFLCTLKIVAETSVTGAVVSYELNDVNPDGSLSQLPPGLELNGDGEIIGTVNQFYNNITQTSGLIRFDGGQTTFDRSAGLFDRSYFFTVKAYDQYGYSAIAQTFNIAVTTPNTMFYSNIVARPFLVPAQRSAWNNFINNASVFSPGSIYRSNDPNFGVQTSLTMLVYAGIQTTNAAAYIGAMGLNNKKKRFQFSSLKKAVATDTVTGEQMYEVVYIQMIDPAEPNGQHKALSIKTKSSISQDISVDSNLDFYSTQLSALNANSLYNDRPNFNVTVDSTGYSASNPRPSVYFPNSITNWQTRLGAVGATERNYLPLWMRSIQPGNKAELDYILAIPLCFCKPETADTILRNIKFNNFDFNSLDYTIDRYTLSSAGGYADDKYLIFKNNRITV